MQRLFLIVLAALLPTPALAAICPDFNGWVPFEFDGITPNSFDVTGGAMITVTGAGSASFMIHPVMVDIAMTPLLTWRWRVDEAGPVTDLSRKGGDDRPVSVYVAFPYDPASASLGERMRRVFVESAQGADAPGRIIAYIWGGKDPAGTRYQSPYTGRETQFVIVEAGDAPRGVWRGVRVNLAEDYRALFGVPPRDVQYVSVFSDSDDTGATTRASVADICFTKE